MHIMERKQDKISLHYNAGKKNIDIFIASIKDILAIANEIRIENVTREEINKKEKTQRLDKVRILKKTILLLVKNKKREVSQLIEEVKTGNLEELKILIRRKNIKIDSLTEFMDLNVDLEFYSKSKKYSKQK
jgi:hypothetical protein